MTVHNDTSKKPFSEPHVVQYGDFRALTQAVGFKGRNDNSKTATNKTSA